MRNAIQCSSFERGSRIQPSETRISTPASSRSDRLVAASCGMEPSSNSPTRAAMSTQASTYTTMDSALKPVVQNRST